MIWLGLVTVDIIFKIRGESFMKAWLEEYGLIIVGIVVVAGLIGLAIWATKRGKDSSVDVVSGFTNRGVAILNNNSIPTSLDGFTYTEWKLAGYMDTDAMTADERSTPEKIDQAGFKQFKEWADGKGYKIGTKSVDADGKVTYTEYSTYVADTVAQALLYRPTTP